MIQPLSSLSHQAYRSIVKPILFKRQPDDVHNTMLRTAERLQEYSPVRRLVSGVWAYQNEPALQQKLHAVTFNNPIGLSAGFDKNFQLPPMLKAIGFGYMEGGSLTFRPCDGNARPWFYRLPKSQSLVVHAGLANQGVEAISKRLRAYPSDTFAGFPLNISIAKTNTQQNADDDQAVADYTGSLSLLKRKNLGDMITINISCPNTFGGEPFTTPKRLDALLDACDAKKAHAPIFIKMPNDLPWEDFRKLLDIAVGHRIAGVTVSNLTKDRHGIRDVLPENIRGGLSGKPTWQRSNELIANTYRRYGDRLTIIGVGGVFSAEDAYTKIRLGASLVELITGMIFEGPQLIGSINHGLVRLLRQDGYEHISEAVGVDT